MYLPRHFREESRDVVRAFIERHPLGTLVTIAGGTLEADHVPMLLDAGRGVHGTLRGHVARANPLWRTVATEAEVLVVFAGADAYISPSNYAAKRTDARVVPTWNYAVVHVRGRIRFFEDADRLRGLVSALTDRHEAARPAPWAVADAPASYVDELLRAIVGFDIEITEVTAKFKASQNRPEVDRAAVRADLAAEHDAQAVHELVRDPTRSGS